MYVMYIFFKGFSTNHILEGTKEVESFPDNLRGVFDIRIPVTVVRKRKT